MSSISRPCAFRAAVATLVGLTVIAALFGGFVLAFSSGGRESPVLHAGATQAPEAERAPAPAEQSSAVMTTNEAPEEMAPTF